MKPQRSRHLTAECEVKSVHDKTVFAHGKFNFVFARCWDIYPDAANYAAVIIKRALPVIPIPLVFSGAELHACTAFRPVAIQAHMDAVIFASAAVGSNPNIISARHSEIDIVGGNRRLARVIAEVLPANKRVVMSKACVRDNTGIPRIITVEGLPLWRAAFRAAPTAFICFTL